MSIKDIVEKWVDGFEFEPKRIKEMLGEKLLRELESKCILKSEHEAQIEALKQVSILKEDVEKKIEELKLYECSCSYNEEKGFEIPCIFCERLEMAFGKDLLNENQSQEEQLTPSDKLGKSLSTVEQVSKLAHQPDANSYLRKQGEISAVENDVHNGVLDDCGETQIISPYLICICGHTTDYHTRRGCTHRFCNCDSFQQESK